MFYRYHRDHDNQLLVLDSKYHCIYKDVFKYADICKRHRVITYKASYYTWAYDNMTGMIATNRNGLFFFANRQTFVRSFINVLNDGKIAVFNYNVVQYSPRSALWFYEGVKFHV